MSLLYPLLCFSALGLSVLTLCAKRRDLESTQNDISAPLASVLVMAAVVLRLSLVSILTHNGMLFCNMDTPARWSIACGWSQHPFAFTSWDGVWLTGGFAFWGVLIRLIPSGSISQQVGILIAQMLTLLSAVYLTWVLTRKRWLAVLAAWVTSCGFLYLWMSQDILAETLLGGVGMLTAAWSLRWLENEGNNSRRAWLYAVATALSAFAATTLHYVGWMALSIAIVFWGLAILVRRREMTTQSWLRLGLIVTGAVAFPLFWFYGSWKHLGHPLQFLWNQTSALTRDNIATNRTDAMVQLMTYPHELNMQLGVLWPLLIGLIWLIWKSPLAARLRSFSLFWLGLAALMITLAARGGTSPNAFRSTILLYSFGLVLAVASLYPSARIWNPGACPKWWRRCAVAVLAVFLLCWTSFNFLMANRRELLAADDWAHDVVVMAIWLKQETRHPQAMKALGEESKIGLYVDGCQGEWLSYFQYVTGCPKHFIPVPKDSSNPPSSAEYDYLLTHGVPVPVNWKELMRCGTWAVWCPVQID